LAALGWNNNPSAKQFSYAYRRLLSRASVSGTGSIAANIIQQDHTDLLHLTPQADNCSDDQFVSSNLINKLISDHDYCTVQRLSVFISSVLEYVSGWVVRTLSPKIACADCLAALVAPANTDSRGKSLLEIKNNGGMVIPSDGVIAVVQQAEKVLREVVNFHQIKKEDHWGHILEMRVLERISGDVFPQLADHFRDTQTGIDSHYSDLVRNMCRSFISLRRYYVINLTNQKLCGKSVRHKLTKTILFKNQ